MRYAPKKARQPEAASPPASPSPSGNAAPAQAAPASTDPPPWRRSRPRIGGGTAFAGDVAIAELRTKLALAPDRLPEPPPPSSGSKLMWAGRLTGVAVVMAVGFVGYRWGSSQNGGFQLPRPSSHARQPVAPDRSVTAPDSVGSLPVMNAVPAVYPRPAKAGPAGGPTFRSLTIGPAPVQQTDEVARLAISAADAGTNAAVMIGGLAPGSTLSAGREVGSNMWRVPVDDLSGLAVTPPRGFVGAMDLTLELHLADNTVADRKGLQLTWVSRGVALKPPPRQHDAAEIAQMVKKGDDLMANGDIAAARLMYQRAAEAGDAAAAFALAETYDPLVLANKGGVPPDVDLAHTWYARAKDMGAPQAGERLDRLTRWDGQ